VVPFADLTQQALALAHSIAKNPPQVLRWTKRLLRDGQTSSLHEILERAANYQALARHTADHHEALEATREKRPPKFSGY
jgi:enoyl-CoA hydratase/carnithine racemase